MQTRLNFQSELSGRFCPKKKASRKLGAVYRRIGYYTKSDRVSHCGDYMEFGVYSDNSVRLHSSNFCKDFLCPMCAWRKELKLFNQVSKIVDVLQAQKYRFVFVTLTMRNCANYGDELKSVISEYNKAYTRLLRLKRIKRVVKGGFRAIEVTYNSECDTLHPHMHIIWAVPNDYFTSKDYITQSELCEMWKNALDIDYTPICDIRCVSGKKVVKKGKVISYDLKSAVAEVCKYAVKSNDYLINSDDINAKVVKSLVEGLSRRRLFVFSGVFADVRKQINLDDVENGDLVHIDDKDNNSTLLYVMHFKWCSEIHGYINVDVTIVNDFVFRECG